MLDLALCRIKFRTHKINQILQPDARMQHKECKDRIQAYPSIAWRCDRFNVQATRSSVI